MTRAGPPRKTGWETWGCPGWKGEGSQKNLLETIYVTQTYKKGG